MSFVFFFDVSGFDYVFSNVLVNFRFLRRFSVFFLSSIGNKLKKLNKLFIVGVLRLGFFKGSYISDL